MRVKRSFALAAGALVLLGLAWYVRNAHRTSTSLAPHEKSPDAPPPSKIAGEPLKGDEVSSPNSSDRNSENGDAVARLIASIDWGAFGSAVLSFTQVQERARREGKKAQYDPAVIETLAKNNIILQKIAEQLGIQDLREAPFHERIWPSYARGWMKAVGVTLSSAQDAELGEAARSFARTRVEESKAMKDSNALEKLAWEADRGLRWDEQAQRFLTPDQFAECIKPAGSDPFWGRQASRQELPIAGIEESARRVQAMWQSTLGLDESLRPFVADAAMEYVREVDRQVAAFRARYPSDAPRDEEMRLRIALLRLQVKAEQSLVPRLGLAPERREGLEQGSGTVLDWRWK